MTVEAKKVTVEAKRVTVGQKLPSPTTVTKTVTTVTNLHQPSPTKKGAVPPVKVGLVAVAGDGSDGKKSYCSTKSENEIHGKQSVCQCQCQ